MNRSSLCRRILALEAVLVASLAALLPFAGRLLYREDPLARADAVYVLAGERVIRWLEASDLVREGWAPRIVLATGFQRPAERRLIGRGVVVASEGEQARSALLQLGHAAESIVLLPESTENTAAEGERLRAYAVERGWKTIIIVTSKLHTRRAGLAFERALDGTGVRIIVRPSRYDEDDPAWWWTKRQTARTFLAELPRLVAYAVGLGS